MTHADRAVSTARWQSVGWVARHPPLGARPSRCAPSGASSWQRHTFVTLAASRTPWLWDVSKGWLTGFEPAISRSTIGPDGPSEQTPNPYAISILALAGAFARGCIPSHVFAGRRGIRGAKTVGNGSVKSSTRRVQICLQTPRD